MSATAVECKLIREGGTHAGAGDAEYHFEPYTDGAHVAVIEDPEHADVFLGIPEGYRLYRGNGTPVSSAAAPSAKPAATPAAPVAMNVCAAMFEPTYTIHGYMYALEEVAEAARKAANLSVEAWNALADIERSDAIEAELDRIAAGPAVTPDEATRETLAADYARLYGKKPHYTMTVEKLRTAIAAKQ